MNLARASRKDCSVITKKKKKKTYAAKGKARFYCRRGFAAACFVALFCFLLDHLLH